MDPIHVLYKLFDDAAINLLVYLNACIFLLFYFKIYPKHLF